MDRTALALAVLATACSAYDTDFGPAPFLCAAAEQRCPRGYTCKADPSSGDEVCVDGSEDPMKFDCDNDGAFEPNDTIAAATVPMLSNNMFKLDTVAICPAGDRDLYRVMVSPNADLEITLEFDQGGAEVSASLLNSNDVAIASVMTIGTRTKRATVQNLPGAAYFVEVTGPSVGVLLVNNYTITASITQ